MNPLNWLARRSKASEHVLILLSISLIVLILPAGSWDLRGPDEGRYVQVAKELLNRDNWFALTVMGRPYDQKPPLAFWLLAMALKANGGEPDSWILRMPSVFAAIGTLLCTYVLGRKFGGTGSGLLSALILLTSIMYLDDAPTVELNMLYTFFTTAALTVWLTRLEERRLSWTRAMIFWLLLSSAFLVKGPLAFLIVLAALGHTAFARRSWQPFLAVRFFPGIALMLAIIGAWFWAQSRAFGSGFVGNQVSGETVGRFLQGDHEQSFWYYFPRIFTAVLGPWAFFFIAALLKAWKNRKNNPAHIAPLLGWIEIPFIILLLANGKRVPYLLPLMPAVCVITGMWMNHHVAPYTMRGIYQKFLAGSGVLLAIIMVGAGIGVHFFAGDLVSRYHSSEVADVSKMKPLLWILGGLLIAILIVFYWKSSRTWITGIWTIAISILIIMGLDFVSVKPTLDLGKSTRYFSETVKEIMAESGVDTIMTLPDLGEPEFHVYGHYNVYSASKSKIDLTNPDLPRLMGLKKREILTSETEVLSAGYKLVRTMKVTKDPVRLYLRDAVTSGS